jgi:F0F1-type ATP synthase membrane subunit b/b'
MVVVTNSWRMWAIGMAVSIGLFAVIYFTVIKPDNNAANQALKSGLQQSQQALGQAQKQVDSAAKQSGGASSQASGIVSQADKQLSTAQKLTACVSAAGTDVSKIQICQSKFGH